MSESYLEFPPPVYIQRGLNLLLERGDLEPLLRQVAVQVEDLLAQVADVVDVLDEQCLLGPEPRHLELEQPDVVQPLVVVLLAAVQRRIQDLRNEPEPSLSCIPIIAASEKSADADARKNFDLNARGCFRAEFEWIPPPPPPPAPPHFCHFGQVRPVVRAGRLQKSRACSRLTSLSLSLPLLCSGRDAANLSRSITID